MPETIDQEARKIATQAHEKARLAQQSIDNHKETSAERWKDMKSMVRGLYTRWWWLMSTIIVGMGTVIVLLLRYQIETVKLQ